MFIFWHFTLQSGTGSSPWVVQDIEGAKEDAIQVGEECGCDTSSSAAMAQCLREQPMDAITAAANKVRN